MSAAREVRISREAYAAIVAMSQHPLLAPVHVLPDGFIILLDVDVLRALADIHADISTAILVLREQRAATGRV